MTDILLTTFNARYGHTGFGLRCLLANMGALQERAKLMEFDVHTPVDKAAESLLAEEPAIIGIGVYIWNTTLVAHLLPLLHAKRPDLRLILGGPEVSYGADPALLAGADYILAGEGDQAFGELCAELLAGRPPPGKIIQAPVPELDQLASPYPLYSHEDLAHRTLYVESSRGCPHQCEYCISSLDPRVRFFPLPPLLKEFKNLLDRGAQHFKFTDRTFNLNIERALAILEFFRGQYRPGLFLHFEMIPDHFPENLLEAVRSFPPFSLQFEVGIQTWSPEVSVRIRRPQDFALIEQNLRALRTTTTAYLHADLIAGLPGESLEEFAAGFNRLLKLRPHEIQVGILKKLKGAGIARHSAEWDMHYETAPPYALIRNALMDRETMERLDRFAHFWEAFYNSGNFIESTPLLWAGTPCPFTAFMDFADWLFRRFQRTHGLALDDLAAALLEYLTSKKGVSVNSSAPLIARDYLRGGRLRLPPILRDHAPAGPSQASPAGQRILAALPAGVKRQARHFDHDLEYFSAHGVQSTEKPIGS